MRYLELTAIQTSLGDGGEETTNTEIAGGGKCIALIWIRIIGNIHRSVLL